MSQHPDHVIPPSHYAFNFCALAALLIVIWAVLEFLTA